GECDQLAKFMGCHVGRVPGTDAQLKTLAVLVIVSASTWLVQPSVFSQLETAADLQDGERAHQATCANCHGPDATWSPASTSGADNSAAPCRTRIWSASSGPASRTRR